MKLFQFCFFLLAIPFLASAQFDLNLEQYATGFDDPVDIVSAGDDRLFIVEQDGVIRILDGNGDLLPDPFISINVNFGANEQGMLGMVFHPDYENNGFFYVNHTGGSGNGFNKIARYTVDASDPNKADPNSEFEIMTVDQPAWNHNAGDLVFGPDGYLYIGFGDGGSGGDPWGNGQNTETFLGKMLRIDVDESSPYAIPADNPFLDDTDILDEIWAVGMRNPWRYSFDKLTGDMWIGDVGQNDREEIDYVAAADVVNGGFNFGWDCREGDLAFEPNNCVSSDVLTEPVASYKIGGTFSCNSVTGGYVYRGCEFPEMYGYYLYADYCNGIIWALIPDGNGGWTNTEVYENGSIDISTFGEDNQGNLYVARHGSGVIYKLTTDFELGELVYEEANDRIVAPTGYEGYEWYRNGELLSGENNETLEGIIALGNADYSCAVAHSNGNCTLVTPELSLMVVSINDVPGISHFEISPNPFSEKVLLDITTDRQLDLTINVLNVNGEVLLEMNRNSSMTYKESIDLGALSSGVYFVRLETKEGKMTRRIVKR